MTNFAKNFPSKQINVYKMNRAIKIIICGIGAMATSLSCKAIMPSEAVFANESADTTRINQLLYKASKINDPQERIATIGQEFIGTPYVSGTLEGDPETLKVNLDQLDCTTFIETVMTIAYTAGEHRTSWHDYVYNLEKIRYRGGVLNGYASRLHYFSDWVVDNVHRGTIKEYTTRMPANDWIVKTIDFMSTNREKYPALTDSTEYERIKSCEIGYRNHRFPYIKASKLSNKAINASLKNGDIIALTTKIPGLDVSHLGIIVKINGIPHLMHASSKKGSVIIDDLSLVDYIRRNGNTGIRIIRLNE